MRFMVLVKSSPETEAGVLPAEQDLAEMGAFNEALVKAGVLVDGGGLHPSARGARVRFSGGARTVTDGPFAEARDLIAGYWIWECASLAEAVAWAERCPMPTPGEAELEIRQVFEAADFGEAYTPELRERDERMRAESAARLGTQAG